jgi:hypothetical protein
MAWKRHRGIAWRVLGPGGCPVAARPENAWAAFPQHLAEHSLGGPCFQEPVVGLSAGRNTPVEIIANQMRALPTQAEVGVCGAWRTVTGSPSSVAYDRGKVIRAAHIKAEYEQSRRRLRCDAQEVSSRGPSGLPTYPTFRPRPLPTRYRYLLCRLPSLSYAADGASWAAPTAAGAPRASDPVPLQPVPR